MQHVKGPEGLSSPPPHLSVPVGYYGSVNIIQARGAFALPTTQFLGFCLTLLQWATKVESVPWTATVYYAGTFDAQLFGIAVGGTWSGVGVTPLVRPPLSGLASSCSAQQVSPAPACLAATF